MGDEYYDEEDGILPGSVSLLDLGVDMNAGLQSWQELYDNGHITYDQHQVVIKNIRLTLSTCLQSYTDQRESIELMEKLDLDF